MLNNPMASKVEAIAYAPGLQDSGDLEAATKSITATSEPGVADYSASLTITAPTSSKLAVNRICARLQVTIDSFGGGGTTLNYRIKRAGTSIGTGTLSTGASTGAKYIAYDITSGTLTGAATYEVFLWVDAGNCVVSVAEVWAAIGSCNASSQQLALTLTHSGLMTPSANLRRVGSGTPELYIYSSDATLLTSPFRQKSISGHLAQLDAMAAIVVSNSIVSVMGSVATDLNYVNNLGANLLSYA